jgi:outer membrane protein assembly factor BamB
MPERSIDELLGRLPEPNIPDPRYEARLRARLTAELHGDPYIQGGPTGTPEAHQFSNMEVIELQTLTKTPTDPEQSRHTWWRAAALLLVAGGVVTALVLAQREDGSPTTSTVPDGTTVPAQVEVSSPSPVETTSPVAVETTSPAPDATFVGSTVDAFAVDPGTNPYFVGAANEVWVSSLSGELLRLDGDTGDIVARATVPESSPFAVDSNAVWVADAISGDVIRLDPVDGSEVARIPTGVEIVPNSVRFPMLEGTTRSFAQTGGIVSTGEAVWVGDRAGAVMRIDPATNEITSTFDVPVRPDLLRAEADRLLIADLLGGKAAVIDTVDGTVVRQQTGLDDLAGAALYGGAVYLQDRATGTVSRIDLATGEELTSEALGAPVERSGTPTLPTGLAVSGAGVLVDTDASPDNVRILDPRTLAEIGTLTTAADQGDMTIASDGSVWLVRSLANEVVHITPAAV